MAGWADACTVMAVTPLAAAAAPRREPFPSIIAGYLPVCASPTTKGDHMKATSKLQVYLALALISSAAVSGCVAAAAAAGAGTGIYLTTRGAESVIEGATSDVASRARS